MSGQERELQMGRKDEASAGRLNDQELVHPLAGRFYSALLGLAEPQSEEELERRTAMALVQSIAANLQRAAQHAAARLGIHVSDLYVIMLLFRASEDHTAKVGAIQRSLGFTAGGMTRRLDSMSRNGLVERLPDPSDGRAWLARLTDRGCALAEEIFAASTARSSLASGRLSAREWRQLSTLLKRVDDASR
jgi:DNA-binding MarR family transcriptional regulator